MAAGRNREVEDDEIIACLREWPKGDVYPSTSTVRDELQEELNADYDRKTVYRRLDSLESEGEIGKIEVGQGRGKSVGWYAEARPEPVTTPREENTGANTDHMGQASDLGGVRMLASKVVQGVKRRFGGNNE